MAPSSPAPGPEAPGIAAPGPLSSDSGVPGARRPSSTQAPPPRPMVASGGGVAWGWRQRLGAGAPENGAGHPGSREESAEFLSNHLSVPSGAILPGALGA